jgi:hypothetical protein
MKERTDFPIAPLPVSHKQYRALTGIAVREDKKYYDLVVKDYVAQPGRINGGIHAGEPLPFVPSADDAEPPSPTIAEDSSLIQRFPTNTGSDIGRPTFNTDGIAVEIRFRKR